MSDFLSQLSAETQKKIINISEMQKLFEFLLRERATKGEWRYYILGKPYAVWQGLKFGARLLFSKKSAREMYQKCGQRSLGMYMMSPVYQGDVLKKAEDYIDVAVMGVIVDWYFPKIRAPRKAFHQKIAACTVEALEQSIDYTPMFLQGDLIVPDYHQEAIERILKDDA